MLKTRTCVLQTPEQLVFSLGASYTFTYPPRIYATVPYMETDKDEGGSCKRFTDLPRISYRSSTEHYGDPRTGLRMKITAQRLGLLTVFLIHKPFLCQSVAYPVRFGYVLGNICWHRSVKDERDATRTSRMGLQTIRTLADELRMRYGRAMDTTSV